jgi:hypothetical protein
LIARIVTYTIIALLAVFVLSTTFVLDHGGGSATPETGDGTISIHDLSLEPDRHEGDTVTTKGTLGFSDATKQYHLVEEGVAVVITDYELEALHALKDQRVTVTGRFDTDPSTGIFIEADTIQVLD